MAWQTEEFISKIYSLNIAICFSCEGSFIGTSKKFEAEFLNCSYADKDSFESIFESQFQFKSFWDRFSHQGESLVVLKFKNDSVSWPARVYFSQNSFTVVIPSQSEILALSHETNSNSSFFFQSPQNLKLVFSSQISKIFGEKIVELSVEDFALKLEEKSRDNILELCKDNFKAVSQKCELILKRENNNDVLWLRFYLTKEIIFGQELVCGEIQDISSQRGAELQVINKQMHLLRTVPLVKRVNNFLERIFVQEHDSNSFLEQLKFFLDSFDFSLATVFQCYNSGDQIHAQRLYCCVSEKLSIKSGSLPSDIQISLFPDIVNALRDKKQRSIDQTIAKGNFKEVMIRNNLFGVLIHPIILGDKEWGFIVLSHTDKSRLSSPFELTVLNIAGVGISQFFNFVSKTQMMDDLEERFEGIIDISGDLLIEADLRGRITFAADNVSRILGFSPSEMLGKTIFQFMVGADARKQMRFYFDQVRKRVGFKKEIVKFIKQDGETSYLEINADLNFSSDGVFIGYRLIMSDVSGRVEVEETVRLNKERLDLSINAAHIGVWDWDILNDSIFWDSMTSGLHNSLKDDDDKTPLVDYDLWISHIHPEDKDYVVREVEDTLNGVKDCFEVEYRVSIGDKNRYVRSEARVHFDELYNPARMIGICRDVTDAKEKEEAMWRLTEYQNVVLNSSSYAIIATDSFGKIMLFNKSAESMLGYSSDDVVNKVSPNSFFTQSEVFEYFKEQAVDFDNCPEFGLSLLVKYADGVSHQKEWTFISKKGVEIPVMLTVTPLRDKQFEVYGHLAMAFDLTETKKLENRIEEERSKSFMSSKMATLGEMAAGVAHEINNPLAIIDGTCQTLLRRIEKTPEKMPPEKIIASISKIKETTTRIAKIVKGLSSFSRDGSLDEAKSESMFEIIDDTLGFCSERFRNNGVELVVDNIPAHFVITCKKSQISQVVLNLLNNAHESVKSIDSSWVRISCEETSDYFKILVKDSGPGVPKEAQDKIFQPFYTTKQLGKGTGLGLSVSTGIIEKHGGKLYYDNERDESTFVIEFPRSISSKEAAA